MINVPGITAIARYGNHGGSHEKIMVRNCAVKNEHNPIRNNTNQYILSSWCFYNRIVPLKQTNQSTNLPRQSLFFTYMNKISQFP